MRQIQLVVQCCRDQKIIYTVYRDLWICLGCGNTFNNNGEMEKHNDF